MSNDKEIISEAFNFEEKVKTLIMEFKKKEQLMTMFKDSIKLLIEKMIYRKEINIHNISCRLKDESSLTKKIQKKGGKYNIITDITDLVGIRIITYFEDDVDKIAQIIEQEFDIDYKNSVDKRKKDYDKFGYQSLHYIVSFPAKRTELMEYSDYIGLKAEIQIRSVLQHAWAEMEHDIGYKSKDEIPEQFKRQFSRLSAALEGADIEFTRIRDDLEKYRNELPKKIEKEPEDVLIDLDSLSKFVETSEIVKHIDAKIAEKESCFIIERENSELLRIYLLMADYLSISNIKDLKDKLLENESIITKFRKLHIQQRAVSESLIERGLSIFYLLMILAVSAKNEQVISGFFEHSNIVSDLSPKELIDMYDKALDT